MTPEDFEVQLQEALKRGNPPAGFAERVIARAEAQASQQRATLEQQAVESQKIQPIRRFSKPAWKPWAVAAAAALLVAAPLSYQRYQEQRAEQAREQTMAALRITAEKFNQMRDKVQRWEARTENIGAGEGDGQ